MSTNYQKTYVGITENPTRRLSQHNNGSHFYTKRYIPWIIVHIEQYNNRLEARDREKYLKSAAGRKWLKKNIFSK
jgi:putative endonuclease